MTARTKAPPEKEAGAHGEGAGGVEAPSGGGIDTSNVLLGAVTTLDRPRCTLCPLVLCHSFCRGVVDQPRRVKVIGDLWHGRVPDGAVYVGRAAPGLKRSRYANPHPVGKPCRVCNGRAHTPAAAVDLYRQYFYGTPGLLDEACRELASRELACWCPLDQDCHADVLLAVVNGGAS